MPGLGIPVSYSDISNACAIVEILTSNPVTSSYGGHLLSNFMTNEIPIFSVVKEQNHYLNHKWLDSAESYYSDKEKLVKVIKVKKGISLRVDGRSSKGVVYTN